MRIWYPPPTSDENISWAGVQAHLPFGRPFVVVFESTVVTTPNQSNEIDTKSHSCAAPRETHMIVVVSSSTHAEDSAGCVTSRKLPAGLGVGNAVGKRLGSPVGSVVGHVVGSGVGVGLRRTMHTTVHESPVFECRTHE